MWWWVFPLLNLHVVISKICYLYIKNYLYPDVYDTGVQKKAPVAKKCHPLQKKFTPSTKVTHII